MNIKLYNSSSKQLEEFRTIEENKVRMYVCGMTVYDYCHIGHARVLIVFDVLFRHLQLLGYDVVYVRNITDIDDKIIQRANENSENFLQLTKRFIDAMHEDAAALNVLTPSKEPLATDHIKEIIIMIEKLLANGHAYVAGGGDVLYSVKSFANYGKVSGKNIDDLQAGARVSVADDKRDPLDFVLWKLAKPEEPSWDSPWGEGRPGWHIECSAMSTTYLGNTFDLHGGGLDLQFPHHENENAQSEGATCQAFANHWMHVGFVQVDKEKMSKSLGNFFTIREVLKQYHPEVIRFFILTSHYRSPLNYSNENLENAKAGLSRLYTALRGLVPDAENCDGELVDQFKSKYYVAMNEDLNTSEALAVLFELAKEINKIKESQPKQANQLAALLIELANGGLGVLQEEPEKFLRSGVAAEEGGLSDSEIDSMLQQREEARKNKEWAEADRLRDLLQDSGIILEDSANGTIWRRK